MILNQLISPSAQTLKCLSIKLPLSCVQSQLILKSNTILGVRGYAKGGPVGIPSLGKKPSKLRNAGPGIEKKRLPVESDANKLVSHLCGSCLTITGEDIKLKEDSEYPEWLWKLNTGKPPSLEDLDPDTEYYWIRVTTIAKRRNLRMMKLKKF